MSADFDPYYRWLGIPPNERPIDYYRLLGIAKFEDNPDVIENAADQRMAHVRNFKTGTHAQHSQPILNELSTARVCLLNPEKKAAYDQKLRAQAEAQSLAAGQSKAGLAVAKPLPAQPIQHSPTPTPQPIGEIPVSHGDPGVPARKSNKWILPVAISAGALVLLAVVGVVVIISSSGSDEDAVAESNPDRGSDRESEPDTKTDTKLPVAESQQPSDEEAIDSEAAQPMDTGSVSPANTATSESTNTGSDQTAPIERTLWRYIQDGKPGTIAHQGASRWLETRPGGMKIEFEETARTDDYIQLYDARREMTLRIYANHGTWRRDGENFWGRVSWSEGGWVNSEQYAANPFQPATDGQKGPGVRYALRFTEMSDRVELANSRGLVFPRRPFTVEAWVRPSEGETSGWFFGTSMKGSAAATSTRTPENWVNFRDWGTPIDPTGESRLLISSSRLTIANPGPYGLSTEKDNFKAPRYLREVTGDFTLTARVDGRFESQKGPDNEIIFQGAGLLLMKDDQTYARLERASLVRDKAVQYVSFELRENGKNRRYALSSDMPLDPAKPVWLRLQRRGDEIRASARQSDDDAWRELAPFEVTLPQTLKVGFAAVSNKETRLLATFSETTFEPDSPANATAAHPDTPRTGGTIQLGWHLLLHENNIVFGNEQAFGIKRPEASGDGWHHVAVCGNGREVRLFVDGKHRSEARTVESLNWQPSSSGIYLGSSPHHSTADKWSLRGDLAGFRVSRNCRYADQFVPPAVLSSDAETVALLDFTQAGGSTLPDLSGRGHTGRIARAQWIDLTRPDGFPIVASTDNGSNETGTSPGSLTSPPAVERQPVPEDKLLEAARKELLSVFEDDLAGAKMPTEKVALMNKMLSLTEDAAAEPATQYVLFDESLGLAVEAGQLDRAYSIVDQMAGAFEIDAWKEKLSVLDDLKELARSPKSREELTARALSLADATANQWRLDVAAEAAQLAYTVSLGVKDTGLRREVRQRRDEVLELKKQAAFAEQAALRLKTEPDNPKANLAYGKYMCLVRGDWDAGLPNLAKGDDQALKTAAQLDLADPQSAEDQLKVADAWWDAAEEAEEPEKQAIQLRALTRYDQAASSATGFTKVRAEKRLEELAKLLKSDSPLSEHAGDGLVGRMFVRGSDIGLYVTYEPGKSVDRYIYMLARDRGVDVSSRTPVSVDLVGKITVDSFSTVTVRNFCSTSFSSSYRATSTLYIDGKPASAVQNNQKIGTVTKIKLTRGTHDVRLMVSGSYLRSFQLSFTDEKGQPLKVYHTKKLAEAARATRTTAAVQLHQ